VSAEPVPYTVRVADRPGDREACFAVRKEVFVEVFVVERGGPEDLAQDAYDAGDAYEAGAVQALTACAHRRCSRHVFTGAALTPGPLTSVVRGCGFGGCGGACRPSGRWGGSGGGPPRRC
jgi:hypothetical protein